METLKRLFLMTLVLCISIYATAQTTLRSEQQAPKIMEMASNLNTIDVNLNVFLEGPFDTTLLQMISGLYYQELLPGMIYTDTSDVGEITTAGQPYYISPWNYYGTEGTTYTNASYDSLAMLHNGYNVVDWILVSFRTDSSAASEVGIVAALVMENGEIHFPKDVVLSSIVDPVYILVEHRNHLSVMSHEPIVIQNGQLTYDFTTQDSYTNTGTGQKLFDNNLWYMYGGDFNQQTDSISYQINGNDRLIWSVENGLFKSYRLADCNMDGEVNGQDKLLWRLNNGFSSSIPR